MDAKRHFADDLKIAASEQMGWMECNIDPDSERSWGELNASEQLFAGAILEEITVAGRFELCRAAGDVRPELYTAPQGSMERFGMRFYVRHVRMGFIVTLDMLIG